MAARNSVLDILESLVLYGVISEFAKDGTSYTLFFHDAPAKVYTTAQVKAFNSGVLATLRAIRDGYTSNETGTWLRTKPAS